ncbi:O-methyltransferase (plasmid) [Mycobacterium intracellulare subsp. chimaera]|uniref:S-adenosyl-L-methionine-dependent methyltransferase n=1 Tax=Mycobacterium intracellulare subsp. chimaera TaxID=222805 RepID=A0A7U5MR67_MYCIT|nr:O-methyltransferase [Mycobacterium intracellulare subsp. chimaera]ASL18228.1 O-methyltransferase [Mycobacterium intracellulare subsp. chimaera]
MINDPFAEPLVRRVGIDFCTKLATGELQGLRADAAKGMRAMIDWMAVRTKYFDDFFLNAARDGIRQAVIVASGLDARAYRLPWAPGTIVFEVDQPQVIEFKTATLAELGAQPMADRRTVAIDLRDDWPAALQRTGFDPALPSAWIAEGLLGYLPADAQDRLLDQVVKLSVSGSRFATHWHPTNADDLDEDEFRRRTGNQSNWWRELGFDLDFAELLYFGGRSDVAAFFATRAWETAVRSNADMLAESGLPPIDAADASFAEVVYLRADLN